MSKIETETSLLIYFSFFFGSIVFLFLLLMFCIKLKILRRKNIKLSVLSINVIKSLTVFCTNVLSRLFIAHQIYLLFIKLFLCVYACSSCFFFFKMCIIIFHLESFKEITDLSLPLALESLASNR